jgi:hypothetical protein
MWSQYVPARLEFTNLDPEQLSRILAWSQVSASRREGWGFPDLAQAPWPGWRGLWRLVGLDEQHEAARLAQP